MKYFPNILKKIKKQKKKFLQHAFLTKSFHQLIRIFAKGKLICLKEETFFICYFAAPRLPLGDYRGDNLSHPMLITACMTIFDPTFSESLVTRFYPLPRPSAQRDSSHSLTTPISFRLLSPISLKFLCRFGAPF